MSPLPVRSCCSYKIGKRQIPNLRRRNLLSQVFQNLKLHRHSSVRISSAGDEAPSASSATPLIQPTPSAEDDNDSDCVDKIESEMAAAVAKRAAAKPHSGESKAELLKRPAALDGHTHFKSMSSHPPQVLGTAAKPGKPTYYNGGTICVSHGRGGCRVLVTRGGRCNKSIPWLKDPALAWTQACCMIGSAREAGI